MTDDEMAQSVLEGLAGVRRCEDCGKLVKLEDLPPVVRLKNQSTVLCNSCWWFEVDQRHDKEQERALNDRHIPWDEQ